MTDVELSLLFQAGTAPERDLQFLERIDRQLQQRQQVAALLRGVKICCVTMLSGGLLVLTQTCHAAFAAGANDVGSSMSSIALPLLAAVICSAVTVLRKQAQ